MANRSISAVDLLRLVDLSTNPGAADPDEVLDIVRRSAPLSDDAPAGTVAAAPLAPAKPETGTEA